MKPLFDHEKLQCYQDSLKFVALAESILQRVPKSIAAWDQLDRASTSIPLNIAEGNGKFTSPDRCRFFDNARGSALECAACLDVLVAKGKLVAGEEVPGKELLYGVVSMLVGLIRSNSDSRLHEESPPYRAGDEEGRRD
jgi:four helix bundle protein